MFKRFRQLRISLAAKCQILFGAAVVMIIAAALFVPWQRLDALMDRLNVQAAQTLADEAKMDHVARETARLEAGGQAAAPIPDKPLPATEPEPTTVALLVGAPAQDAEHPSTQPGGVLIAGYLPPRLIPADPPPGNAVSRFERRALRTFKDRPNVEFYAQAYQVNGTDRYRYAEPLYAEQSCLRCHAESGASTQPLAAAAAAAGGGVGADTATPGNGPRPVTTEPAAALPPPPATGPIPARLLGAVSVDIVSQVDANQIFLNRVFMLLAGLIAGLLAIVVFYLITDRVFLQPVRVLQVTAEKVSQGDLDIRSDISTGDEFQQLSETFNTMLTNLKLNADQLRSINKSLDLKLGQLAESNVALYESNRLKSEFLANVSHELRTPLNSILGFAELLRDTVVASGAEAKPARYVQNILTSGRNLLELINDLLDLAKIEAGRMEVRAEPLSLGDVFEGLANLLKPLAEPKGLTIQGTVAPDVPIIHSDPAKLQQVLYNFLSNAIKFSPAGGQIDLTAVREDEEAVRITVTDAGPGIDPEKQAVIFEKFRQLDGSVTRQHSGTGLGLAISKELISLLGGSIGVNSNPGRGAAFWIILPLKTQAGPRDVRSKMVMS